MELRTIDFDYSVLDVTTKDFLEERANIIYGIQSKSAYDIGKQLLQAKEKLAKNRYGCFEEWYRSLGFKKTKAYEYINHYNFIRSQSEQLNIEKFEELPQKLQAEMSKPSANPEVNQAVFNGDITTHKEYKELERQLKLAEAENKRLVNEKEQQAEQILNLKTQQPKAEVKVVERNVVKEVVPDDYQETKDLNKTLLDKNQELQRRFEDLESRNQFIEEQHQRLLAQRAEVDEKSSKYDELTKAIEASKGQLDAYQKKIFAYKEIQSLLKKGNQLLSNVGGIVYVDVKPVIETEPAIKNELETFYFLLSSFTKEVAELLNEQEIIEGEIL